MDEGLKNLKPKEYIPLPSKEEYPQKRPRNAVEFDKRLGAIGSRLSEANPDIGKFRFSVFESPIPNVEHFTKRHIFMSDKLLSFAKNESQIAFMLSHEMAHWINRDLTSYGARIPIDIEDIKKSECRAQASGIIIYLRAGYPKEEAVNLIKTIRKSYTTDDMICDIP